MDTCDHLPGDVGKGVEPVPAKRWLNRTVVGAGITSGLGDFCYETTTVILPGFLAVLGIPAAALGTLPINSGIGNCWS
jgi:hypothetical protein